MCERFQIEISKPEEIIGVYTEQTDEHGKIDSGRHADHIYSIFIKASPPLSF